MTWSAQVPVTPEIHNPLPTITGRQVISVALAILFLVGFVVVFILSAAILSSAAKTFIVELPKLHLLLAASVLQCAAMIGAVHWVLIRHTGYSWKLFGFFPVSSKQLTVAILLGIVLVPILETVERLAGITLGDTIVQLLAPTGFTWTGLVGSVLVIGVATPVAEEIVFRGVVYAWLRSRWRLLPALLFNGALFGGIHLFYPAPYVILVGLLGVVFAYAYEKTGTLWVPSLMHALHNSTVIIAVYWALP